MPLSFAQMDEITRKITYKPGWNIALRHGYLMPWNQDFTGAGAVIELSYMAPDSRKTCFSYPASLYSYGSGMAPSISVSGRFAVPGYFEEDWQFVRWLKREVIIHAEMHEVDEFFRVAGVLVDDPHAVRPALPRQPADLLEGTDGRIPDL